MGLHFQKVRWPLGGASADGGPRARARVRARTPRASAEQASGRQHAGRRPRSQESPSAERLRGVPGRPRGDSLPSRDGHPMRSPGGGPTRTGTVPASRAPTRAPGLGLLGRQALAPVADPEPGVSVGRRPSATPAPPPLTLPRSPPKKHPGTPKRKLGAATAPKVPKMRRNRIRPSRRPHKPPKKGNVDTPTYVVSELLRPVQFPKKTHYQNFDPLNQSPLALRELPLLHHYQVPADGT